MKTLLITLLLSISIFGQSGKSNLTQQQKDSIGAMIRDSSGYVTPEQFGAAKDGVTDDYNAINSAFDEAITSGKGIYFSSGTYKINSPITKTGFNKNNPLVIRGSGSTILDFSDYSGSTVLNLRSDYSDTTWVKENISKGDSILVFAIKSGVSFERDDIVELRSAAFWNKSYGTYTKGELLRVRRTSNDTLFFYSPAADDYNKDSTTYIRNCNAAKVVIDNITIRGSGAVSSGGGLSLSYFRDVNITNLNLGDIYAEALGLISIKGGLIQNITTFENQRPGQGYGISIQNSQDLTIRDCVLDGARHAIAVSGAYPARYLTFTGNKLSCSPPYTDAGLLDVHPNGQFVTINDNVLKNGYIYVRSSNVVISNNITKGIKIYVGSADYGVEKDYIIIKDNVTTSGISVAYFGGYTTDIDTIKYFSISGNSITNNDLGYDILFGASASNSNYRLHINNLDIKNNILKEEVNYASSSMLFDDSLSIDRLTITNNVIEAKNTGIDFKTDAEIKVLVLRDNQITSDLWYGVLGQGFIQDGFVEDNIFRGIRKNIINFKNLYFRNNVFYGGGYTISANVDSLFYNDNVLLNGATTSNSAVVTLGSNIRLVGTGSNAFNGDAIADTILINGASESDIYSITPYGSSIKYKDILSAVAKTDTLIVIRPEHDVVVETVVEDSLISNGDFVDSTDWTLPDSVTISGGTLNYLSGAGQNTTQSMLVQKDSTYKITYTITDYTSGAMLVSVGGYNSGQIRQAAGTYTDVIKVTYNSPSQLFYIIKYIPAIYGEFIGSIDNVSVEQVRYSETYSTEGLTYTYWRYR